jgi:hypothetical protein
VLFVAAVALCARSAAAQVGEQFVEGQRANAQALGKYQWKSRTEVRQGGESRSVQIFLVRYGIDGSVQKTPIGGTPPADLPRHPLRRKIVEKKTKEYQELVRELGELAQSYGSLPPDRMQAVLGTANMITPLGGPLDSVQVQAKNVLRPGDSLTLWIDSATHQQRKSEIRTVLDAKPVAVVTEFRSLPGGPTYAARVVIDYPSAGLQVVTDSFDHQL